MTTQRTISFTALLAVLLAAPMAPAASPVIDDINDGFLPGNFIFDSVAVPNVGWVYEPGFDYLLDGIFSTFRTVTNPTTTRDVTLSVYDDVPDNGGNLLRTGTFSAGGGGGNLGIMFAPLAVEAGEDYFIAYDNVGGLGLNIVDFAVSLPGGVPNPAVQFQSGWYTGTDFGTFIPHTDMAPAGFAAPILRFTGVIPEPSTALLATLALIAAIGHRRR